MLRSGLPTLFVTFSSWLLSVVRLCVNVETRIESNVYVWMSLMMELCRPFRGKVLFAHKNLYYCNDCQLAQTVISFYCFRDNESSSFWQDQVISLRMWSMRFYSLTAVWTRFIEGDNDPEILIHILSKGQVPFCHHWAVHHSGTKQACSTFQKFERQGSQER